MSRILPALALLAAPALLAAQESDWWAYRPLYAPEVPPGAAHPIDAFVRARLAERGLEPAPRATPEVLLRRATFDLIGLPPTPEERARFFAEVAERGFDAAWALLIDELLARPQYAEAWARHWLDLVRFAETNGYERDGEKDNMWRYRDWVVRALDADLPYDEFIVQQLAGDELAGLEREGSVPTEVAQLALATGYFRLGIWDDEPADPEQARWDELADIVDTTGQVFLGTTFGCARCHDHKADPISQREYYAFTAYFNHVEGYGGGEFGQHLGGGQTRLVPDRPGDGVGRIEERNAEVAEIDARLESELARGAELVRIEGLGALEEEPRVYVPDARSSAHVWRHLADFEEPPADWPTPAFDDSAWEEGPAGFGTAITPGAVVGTTWESARILLRTTFRLTELPKALVLSVHHDDDAEVFLNGARVATLPGARGDYTELQLGLEAQHALVVGRNVLAVACRDTGGAQFVDAGLRSGYLPDAPWLVRLEHELAARPDDPALAELQTLWAERAHVLSRPVAEPYPAQVVAEREGVPEPQHVLGRGSAHAPGDVVEPRLPEAFRAAAGSIEPELPAQREEAATSGRRLALARWLVEKGAFLTARVHANRLWQFHFGRGLCRSPGDFGRLGERPTHQELLDHLAHELVARGWSQKALHRYLMTSETYQQASSQHALADDPRNDLLAWFDPRRLTAEEYRDAVLLVSGRLNPELHGPPVFPPLDEAVLATASRPGEAWGDATEEQATRRSLYVFVKRSLRMPLFESLDQPDPDLPCPERFPTNVPTQALITLNGDFVTDAAADFAARLESDGGSLEERLGRGVCLAYAREAGEEELARHADFVRGLMAERGLSERDALAAWCLVIFNTNEFLWID